MDWIERWFGVAPDNGDGTLELLIVLFIIAVVLVPAAVRHPWIRAALARFIRIHRVGSAGR
jgi:hypothetical protein